MLAAYYSYRKSKSFLSSRDDELQDHIYLRARRLKRNLTGKRFKFVSIDQASMWTLEWIKTFPERFDLIVGIPRSGMFVASLIALKLGKALTTPELLQQGKYWHSTVVDETIPLDGAARVLLVDDAVYSGNSIARAEQSIRSVYKDLSIARASLIVDKMSKSKVDYCYKLVEPPRVYEWNILHRKIASQFGNGTLAVDMDGVLCENCPRAADEDEKLYVEWLSRAHPYLIPSFEIDAIVTSRLEKYRPETERWLRKHGVRYKDLHMWDIDDKSRRKGKFDAYKSKILLKLKPDLYWESNWGLAKAVWKKTSIPTLCIDEMILLS